MGFRFGSDATCTTSSGFNCCAGTTPGPTFEVCFTMDWCACPDEIIEFEVTLEGGGETITGAFGTGIFSPNILCLDVPEPGDASDVVITATVSFVSGSAVYDLPQTFDLTVSSPYPDSSFHGSVPMDEGWQCCGIPIPDPLVLTVPGWGDHALSPVDPVALGIDGTCVEFGCAFLVSIVDSLYRYDFYVYTCRVLGSGLAVWRLRAISTRLSDSVVVANYIVPSDCPDDPLCREDCATGDWDVPFPLSITPVAGDPPAGTYSIHD